MRSSEVVCGTPLAIPLGGRIECVYYASGEYDVVAITEMPDNLSMAAISLLRMFFTALVAKQVGQISS